MMKQIDKVSFNKWIIIFIWILVLTVLETVMQNLFKINSVVPDLLFVFSLSVASVKKELKDIILIAVVCGIISDFICHSHSFGYMAVYTYSAMGIYFLKSVFLKPNIFFMSVFALVIFLFAKTIIYPVFYFDKGIGFGTYFVNNGVPQAFYNTLCFFIITMILKLSKKREEKM